jgi:hypothetical protein
MHVCTSAHRTKSEITDTPLALLPRKVFLLPFFGFLLTTFGSPPRCRHRVMASQACEFFFFLDSKLLACPGREGRVEEWGRAKENRVNRGEWT